jgi:hypothetical protein
MTSKRFEETRIGWMRVNDDLAPGTTLTIGHFNCPECKAIFCYVNDADDRLPPAFCPSCGRKNANAS